MTWNYEQIKELAKEEKISVNDFLVLSPTNDPFYVGSPGQIQKAEWFSTIYNKMGRPSECHIRRVHYWLVSQSPKYKKPDGTEYLNTLNDWNFLTLAAKYARYAELVPVDNIIDRRNPPAIINADFWENDTPTSIKERTDAQDIIRDIVRNFYCYNPHNTQPYMIELWCEKSTMNDVLEPIAKRYGANLVTGLGELSITAVHELIKRLEEADKPVRIFYISDFDPAGECMPVSVSRKIEYFIRTENIGQDVRLKQIMLTPEQCQEFKLPRTPIKPTEKRKEGFEDRHGMGATELDALEALHPGEMKKIITSEIIKYFDSEAWNEAINLNSEIQSKVRDYLQDKITDVLEELDLTEYDDQEIETGSTIDDDDEQWIYNSELDYQEQLEQYKEYKR